MKLNYKIPTKSFYLLYSDENERDFDEVVFEAKDEDVENFVLIKIFNDFFSEEMHDMCETKELIGFINNFISSLDLWEKVKDFYMSEIRDYFEDDARKYGYKTK